MLLFKTDRQKSEYDNLRLKNPALHELGSLVEAYVRLELKKDVVITEVYRSQEENDALYAQTPPGLRPKNPESPHTRWEAFDLRSSIYDDAEVQRIMGFVNCLRYIQGRSVGIYHQIQGNAWHCHIQYRGHNEAA